MMKFKAAVYVQPKGELIAFAESYEKAKLFKEKVSPHLQRFNREWWAEIREVLDIDYDYYKYIDDDDLLEIDKGILAYIYNIHYYGGCLQIDICEAFEDAIFLLRLIGWYGELGGNGDSFVVPAIGTMLLKLGFYPPVKAKYYKQGRKVCRECADPKKAAFWLGALSVLMESDPACRLSDPELPMRRWGDVANFPEYKEGKSRLRNAFKKIIKIIQNEKKADILKRLVRWYHIDDREVWYEEVELREKMEEIFEELFE